MRVPRLATAAALALPTVLASCRDEPAPVTDAPGATAAPAAAPAPWLEDVTDASGVDFVHVSGHRDRAYIPEIMCGGAALLDVDGDGDLDLYLVQGGRVDEPAGAATPPNRLYRNDGAMRFTDITSGSGADDRGYGIGAATGDYDGDGDLDLYVTNVGPNVLLRNEGDGTFTDVTSAAGVGHDGYGSSAAFLDADHDGDLDLVVLNYLHWSPATEIDCVNDLGEPDYCAPGSYQAPAADVLYRNEGDGTFTDVSDAAGLAGALGTGLGIACADFDGDGRTDVFVANDGMPDHLWMNQGDGTFREDADVLGVGLDHDGKAKAGMGVTVGDVDRDGDPDLLVCNLVRETDSFFVNEGRYFRDATAAAGLARASRPFTRFGMAWVDLDHDGHLDLYQANGRVARQAETWADDPFAEPNLLLRGGAGASFAEVEPRGGTAAPLVATSRAAAFGDLDDDGDVDVVVVNRDARVHVLRNVAPKRGASLVLRVLDARGRDAIGAVVTVETGRHDLRREVRTAYSYCAANDPRVHVGLGDATPTGLVVRWVDGTVERFEPPAPGGVAVVRRGAGR